MHVRAAVQRCGCVAVHVGDAVVVGPLRAAAARRRQGPVLRGAQEVPRLPQRAGRARGRGRARVPRQHQPPPAGGDGDTQVRNHIIVTFNCVETSLEANPNRYERKYAKFRHFR